MIWRPRATSRRSPATSGWPVARATSGLIPMGCPPSVWDAGGVDVIDDYLSGLDRRLVGPRRAKADLLAEARDSLVDATEAYAVRGVADAQARAVAEFGTYLQVAPAYQAELAATQGRRTALFVAVALPLLHLLAPLMWTGSPWSGQPRGAGYFSLTDAFDYLSMVGGGVAALVWLAYGPGSRYVRDSRRLTRGLGVGALVFLGVHGVAGAAVFAWSFLTWPATLTWPPVVAGVVLMWIGFAYTAHSAWRCVRASGPREVSPSPLAAA